MVQVHVPCPERVEFQDGVIDSANTGHWSGADPALEHPRHVADQRTDVVAWGVKS